MEQSNLSLYINKLVFYLKIVFTVSAVMILLQYVWHLFLFCLHITRKSTTNIVMP